MSWRYFTLNEFACHCGCGQNLINHQFVTDLDELRHRYGASLTVSSGYRCPDHNAKVSSTGRTGPHTTGRATDLLVDRGNAYKLLKIAMEIGFTGIGVQQKGSGRFLHFDNLPNAPGQPRPTIFSY